MSREKFPNRRESSIVAFHWGNAQYRVGFSLAADGSVGEVFISSSKPGNDGEANARDGAILASLALQQGSTIEELCASLTKEEDGAPATIIGEALELVRRAHAGGTETALQSDPPFHRGGL